jgi:hypothetical protein
MDTIYQKIRVATVAPVLATLFLVVLRLSRPELFTVPGSFAVLLLSLGLMPLLAYPMQKHLPRFRNRGRKGQRLLAMIFAVFGYILSAVLLVVIKAPRELLLISLEYLISGAVLLVINRCFGIHASGHACGAIAPVVLFLSFREWALAMVGCVIAVVTFIASVRTGRHTSGQLMGGLVITSLVGLFLNCVLL